MIQKKVMVEYLISEGQHVTKNDLKIEYMLFSNLKPEDMRLEDINISTEKGFSGISSQQLIEFSLSFSKELSLAIVADIICHFIRNKAHKLWINNHNTVLTKENILKSLEEADKKAED